MEHTKYTGIFPAFYACYDDNQDVSLSRVRALARFLVDKGVQGLYVNGSSGECIYLEKEERMAILEAVMEEVGGQCTVIAHVACNNTRSSMELAAHAEKLGVDAIASIPPIYFHLPEYAIKEYWNSISSAAPHTDFFLYNIPQLAGVALTPSLFLEMLKNPRVVGVKNSSLSAYDIETFLRLGEGRITVFNGPDEQFVAGRTTGAAGGIGGTYAAMPELFLKMDQLIRENHVSEAALIQHEVNAIIEDLCSLRGNMYAVIKKVIELNGGPSLGGVRSPLPQLSREDMPKAEAVASRIRQTVKRFV